MSGVREGRERIIGFILGATEADNRRLERFVGGLRAASGVTGAGTGSGKRRAASGFAAAGHGGGRRSTAPANPRCHGE